MMYCTFATMFIAQAYGVHMTIAQQITMLLLLMITSKGIAGVPRASLVVIAATLTYFGLPEARACCWSWPSTTCSTWAARPPTSSATPSPPPWSPSGKTFDCPKVPDARVRPDRPPAGPGLACRRTRGGA
jgi:hypothetical protein